MNENNNNKKKKRKALCPFWTSLARFEIWSFCQVWIWMYSKVFHVQLGFISHNPPPSHSNKADCPDAITWTYTTWHAHVQTEPWSLWQSIYSLLWPPSKITKKTLVMKCQQLNLSYCEMFGLFFYDFSPFFPFPPPPSPECLMHVSSTWPPCFCPHPLSGSAIRCFQGRQTDSHLGESWLRVWLAAALPDWMDQIKHLW